MPMGQPSNVMGASDQGDCGCGGPQFGPMMHQQMPQGMQQQPYGYGPGMMGQGMPGQGMPMGPQGQGMMPMGPQGQGMPMGPQGQGMQMGSPGMFGPRAFAMPNFNDDDFEG
jgi:morphogenetic protein associated with SpoVID